MMAAPTMDLIPVLGYMRPGMLATFALVLAISRNHQHVPWLKGLGLQTITFADWGRTWNHDLEGADVAPPPSPDPTEGPTRSTYGTTGWRMDAGIGFGKLLGVPGQRGNLRLYIAHQILDGQRDAGWRVLLALEK